MNGSTCTCKAPATRLLRVIDPKLPRGGGRSEVIPIFGERATRWATCEEHRHLYAEVLRRQWADEIAAGTVKVLIGKRHRAGL